MTSISVDDNIKSIKERLETLRIETLRLEGSLKVFQEIKNAGAEWIQLGNQSTVLNTKEVVDTVPDRREPTQTSPQQIPTEYISNITC